MPDRDERAPEDSELREVEDEAGEVKDLPEGSNPDSPQHRSAKDNLDEAKSEQPED